MRLGAFLFLSLVVAESQSWSGAQPREEAQGWHDTLLAGTILFFIFFVKKKKRLWTGAHPPNRQAASQPASRISRECWLFPPPCFVLFFFLGNSHPWTGAEQTTVTDIWMAEGVFYVFYYLYFSFSSLFLLLYFQKTKPRTGAKQKPNTQLYVMECWHQRANNKTKQNSQAQELTRVTPVQPQPTLSLSLSVVTNSEIVPGRSEITDTHINIIVFY